MTQRALRLLGKRETLSVMEDWDWRASASSPSWRRCEREGATSNNSSALGASGMTAWMEGEQRRRDTPQRSSRGSNEGLQRAVPGLAGF